LCIEQKCSLYQHGKDFTVTLPTVSKQTLAAAGNVAGRTPFQIKLANCSEGKVATYFEPGATVDFNYFLKNKKKYHEFRVNMTNALFELRFCF